MAIFMRNPFRSSVDETTVDVLDNSIILSGHPRTHKSS